MMNRKGFTLIELLIVVVIIGILAAIAIPKFATTKDKAKLASVKTDIRNYMTAQEAYFSDKAMYGDAARPGRRRVQLHLLERQRGHRELGRRGGLQPDRPEREHLDRHQVVPGRRGRQGCRARR